jgi:hypothetical protein
MFASRTRILGAEVHLTESSVGATKEVGEPNHAGNQGGASLWWIWSPPEDGTVVIDTEGTQFETLLGVYFGKDFSKLDVIAASSVGPNAPYSRVVFDATTTRDYVIAVDGKNGASGDVHLNLKLYTVPVILAQPQPVDATVGDTVSFRVSAIGRNPLYYQWQHSGINLPGQTESNLTLPAVSKADAGYYRVVITNTVGAVTSSNALLRVLARPKVVEQPQSVQCDSGEDVTFSVKALGDEPLAYQWQFNKADLPRRIGPLLSLTNVSTDDSGPYRVVVSNIAGVAISEEAKLVVVPCPPAITIQPTNQVVVEGTDVRMVVGAKGYRPLSYQWLRDERVVSGQTNPVALLPKVKTNDSGIYAADVSNRYGTRRSLDAKLTVEPRPPNDFFTNRIRLTGTQVKTNGFNKHGTAEPGEPFHDRQRPLHSVWWSYTATARGIVTVDLAGSTFDTVVGIYQGPSVSNLVQVASNDNGPNGRAQSFVQFLAEPDIEYAIAVDGIEGQQGEGDITLQVNFSTEIGLPVFDLGFGPFDLFALGPAGGGGCREGEFAARAISIAPVSYQWQFNGVDLPASSNPTATNARLVLTNITLEMAGLCQVIACNVAGCATSPPARLTVSPLPLITSQPRDTIVRECGNPSLVVGVDGGCSAVAVQWFFQGLAFQGATTPVLNITNAQPAQSGPYFAVLSNEFGAVTSRVATLTVDSTPIITRHPKAPDAEDQRHRVPCGVSPDGPWPG